MNLQVGKEYKTRSGKTCSIIRSFNDPPKGDRFYKQKDYIFYIASFKGVLERYNGDGSYIKPSIQHPLDIIEEV